MSYSKILSLFGALLAIHAWLQGPELLAAWILVGVGCAFWWKEPRFFRAVVASEVITALGYCLLVRESHQLLWLTHNSSLPAYAWLAIPAVFNVVSCCICVGIPYALTTRLRMLRSRSGRKVVQEPTYSLPYLTKQTV